jgi:hypothetical protein
VRDFRSFGHVKSGERTGLCSGLCMKLSRHVDRKSHGDAARAQSLESSVLDSRPKTQAAEPGDDFGIASSCLAITPITSRKSQVRNDCTPTDLYPLS